MHCGSLHDYLNEFKYIPKHFHTYSMWGKLVHAQNFTWLWINCPGQVENWKAKTNNCSGGVGGDSSVVRVLDLWSKGQGLEYQHEWRENFLLWGQLSCANPYFSIHSTPMLLQQHIKDPGHSAKMLVTAKHTSTLHMWLYHSFRSHATWVQ